MNAIEASDYLARLLNETSPDDMKGFIEQIPNEIGVFDIKEKRTLQGLAFYDWHICFCEDISVEMRGNWGSPAIQFIFFTETGMEWSFREKRYGVRADKGDLCVYRSSELTSVGSYIGGSDFSCQSVQIPADYFSRLLDAYFSESEQHILEELLKGTATTPITPRMTRILREIKDGEQYSGGTAGLYLEGKLLELLSVCLGQMTGASRPADREIPISPSDRLLFLDIKEKIDSNVGADFSLDCLARQAHVSVSKLTKGFSALTGMTLHSYIIEKRLERAALLLSGRRMNVSQAAMACGYSNMSHFSASFKKRYGVLPKDYADFH